MAALTGKARIAETYLAGLGASGALIAGAVIGFLLLVGTVAFDGWPRAASPLEFGGAEEERVVETGVPADAAATALAPATDLVAAAEPGAPLVTAPGGSIDDGGGGGAGAQTPAGGQQGGTNTGGGGGGTITETVNNTGDTLNTTVNDLAETVDQTVTGLGQTVDSTLNNTVNTVNGLLKGLAGN